MNRAGSRGFTLIEVVTSTVILSALVLAAASVSKTALSATSVVVSADAANARVHHSLETLRRRFLSASSATLQAIPTVQGGVPEPMQAGVDYDNVRFRVVTGFALGAVVLEPPVAAPPCRVFASAGALWLDDGAATTMLLDNVTTAAFRLSGRNLQVTLVAGRPGTHDDASFEMGLILLVP